MIFSIYYSNQSKKFIEKLEKISKNRVKKAIEKLLENPFPKETTRVESYKDYKVFRIRIGHFRILYFVDYDDTSITIIKIDKRERVY